METTGGIGGDGAVRPVPPLADVLAEAARLRAVLQAMALATAPAPAPAPASDAGAAHGDRERRRLQAERVDVLAELEALKSSACAAQARIAVELHADEVRLDAARGVRAERRGRTAAAQVALARRESPHRGSTLLGAARAWIAEMPATFAALAAGRLSEWIGVGLVRETACLPVDARREVDRRVCGDLTAVVGFGERRLLGRDTA